MLQADPVFALVTATARALISANIRPSLLCLILYAELRTFNGTSPKMVLRMTVILKKLFLSHEH